MYENCLSCILDNYDVPKKSHDSKLDDEKVSILCHNNNCCLT